MSVAVALLAALIFGTGDFLGGYATRRTPLLSVLLVSQGVGLAGMCVAAAATGGVAGGGDLVDGAVGGLAGAAGVALLYRGLATAQMSLVAPITGVVAVAVPVAAGVALGERPAALQYAGIGIAALAVGLLSAGSGRDAPLSRSAILLAAGAGLAFGIFYVALSRASAGAQLWPLVSARGASVTALLAITGVTRRRPSFGGTRPLVIVVAGVCDVTANALYLIAVHGGLLSIVAVLVSLYPVSTVLLSLLVMHERLRGAQVAGVAAALAAVTLIATG